MPFEERKTTTQNIEIRDLPVRVVRELNALAQLKGLRKWEIVREAILEYVTHHRASIPVAVFDSCKD